jgi:hypothetical protein
MINKLEQIENMESIRLDLWEKISEEQDELKRLTGLRDAWIIPMCSRADLLENKLNIDLCEDKIKMLLKSYALITGEISRLCLQ